MPNSHTLITKNVDLKVQICNKNKLHDTKALCFSFFTHGIRKEYNTKIKDLMYLGQQHIISSSGADAIRRAMGDHVRLPATGSSAYLPPSFFNDYQYIDSL